MGSLQEELKKQIERLGMVHTIAKEEAPPQQTTTLAEQRKLAGIVEKEPSREAATDASKKPVAP